MILAVALAAIFGCFVGSFLNVVVHRLPRSESVVHPPSRCYACGTRLTWHDNLPILGYLLLRGHCRHCGTPYSPRYLLGELACGLLTAGVVLAVLLTWRDAAPGGQDVSFFTPAPVLSGASGQLALLAPASAIAALLVLAWYLFVSARIDLHHTIIPDELSKPLQVLAPFLALGINNLAAVTSSDGLWWYPVRFGIERNILGEVAFSPGALVAWSLALCALGVAALLLTLTLARWIYTNRAHPGEAWNDEDHRGFRRGVQWFCLSLVPAALVCASVGLTTDSGPGFLVTAQLANALLGSLVGFGALYAVGLIGTFLLRRNAMGFGDCKLLAPIGCFLGPIGILEAFAAAALLGTAVGIPLRFLRRTVQIPFGPYLAGGAAIVLCVGPWLPRWG